MKITEKIFGVDAVIDIVDQNVKIDDVNEIFEYFHTIETLTNSRRKDSEIAKVNTHRIQVEEISPEVRKIIRVCEDAKIVTHGFFNAYVESLFDPSGLIKGYAIHHATLRLLKIGYKHFYLEIGSDLQIEGNKNGLAWKVGIRNFPLKKFHVLKISGRGIATSGLSMRKIPIYNPLTKKIVKHYDSVTVVAKNVLEADFLSTAAYAMGERGVNFIENTPGAEALFVRPNGEEVLTTGLKAYM